jgi:hypothetical protein
MKHLALSVPLILACSSSGLRSPVADGASPPGGGAGGHVVDASPTAETFPNADSILPVPAVCIPIDAGPAGCTDVQNDPLNCGELGHDCQGAACVAGVCGPLPNTLASGQAPSSLAVDESNVYWVNSLPQPLGSAGHSQVMRCPIAGCDGQPVTLWDGLYPIMGALAVEQGAVWWNTGPGGIVSTPYGTDPTILHCATGGCSGTPTSLVRANSVFRTFTADATSAYWSTFGTLSTCALAGCGESPTVIHDSDTIIYALAVNATTIFWTDGGGALSSCPLAGCGGGPGVLGAANPLMSVLAADNDHVYWIDPGTRVGGGKLGPVTQWLGGAVLECPVTGCNGSPTVLASYPSWLAGGALAIDGADVYWSTEDGSGRYGEIVRCRTDGCGGKPTPVAATAGPSPAPGLAVDSRHIFWADPGRGTVMIADK